MVFAGNLEKSHFLRQLDRVDWDKNVYLFLYGSWSDNVVIMIEFSIKENFLQIILKKLKEIGDLYGMGNQ